MNIEAQLNRAMARARKQYAARVAHIPDAETPKAMRKAERKANAARRQLREAMRSADDWQGFAI